MKYLKLYADKTDFLENKNIKHEPYSYLLDAEHKPLIGDHPTEGITGQAVAGVAVAGSEW